MKYSSFISTVATALLVQTVSAIDLDTATLAEVDPSTVTLEQVKAAKVAEATGVNWCYKFISKSSGTLEIQNEILEKCDKVINPSVKFSKIPVDDLKKLLDGEVLDKNFLDKIDYTLSDDADHFCKQVKLEDLLDNIPEFSVKRQIMSKCKIGIHASTKTVAPTKKNPPTPPSLPTDPTVPPTDPSVPPTDPTVPPTDPTVPPTDPTVPPSDPTVPPIDSTIPPIDTNLPKTESQPELPNSNTKESKNSGGASDETKIDELTKTIKELVEAELTSESLAILNQKIESVPAGRAKWCDVIEENEDKIKAADEKLMVKAKEKCNSTTSTTAPAASDVKDNNGASSYIGAGIGSIALAALLFI